ncbi:MAG: ABC transporter ATP-binding protein [Rhodospirillales bacterium]|tara:strand:+ start:56 stop:1099 length:1044 start_codon:yes stop_codon:yes gene_type:complete
MLRISGLSYKVQQKLILNKISLEAKSGEIICLLGPSGCGKTSTLRLIAGLERPISGTISIANQNVTSDKIFIEPHKRKVGFLFQDFALFPHLTAKQNIIWALGKRTHNKQVAELFEQINMVGHEHKYPHEMSGGEQQRVALARSIVTNPRILLLDEPFSSLDTNLRNEIRDYTISLLKQMGITAVIVTHDPEEAMLIADRIILMNNGEITQSGSAFELYHEPVDKFAASFLGPINCFKGTFSNNLIKTAIGDIPYNEPCSEKELNVVMRPDTLKLIPNERMDEKDLGAKVEEVRIIGGMEHIRCSLLKQDKDKEYIFISQSAENQLKVGDRGNINFNRDKVIIFKRD